MAAPILRRAVPAHCIHPPTPHLYLTPHLDRPGLCRSPRPPHTHQEPESQTQAWGCPSPGSGPSITTRHRPASLPTSLPLPPAPCREPKSALRVFGLHVGNGGGSRAGGKDSGEPGQPGHQPRPPPRFQPPSPASPAALLSGWKGAPGPLRGAVQTSRKQAAVWGPVWVSPGSWATPTHPSWHLGHERERCLKCKRQSREVTQPNSPEAQISTWDATWNPGTAGHSGKQLGCPLVSKRLGFEVQ